MVDYKGYRPRSMTLEATAAITGISTRSLIRYDRLEQVPPDETAVKLANTYGTPALLFEHHGYNTTIGRLFFCRPLNSINRSFPAICFKSREELQEMVSAIDGMCHMVLNGQELEKWGMTEEFDRHFQELIDVEQLVLEAKIIYAEIRGLKALEERYREHDAKCLTNGYRTDKRKTPQAAEARAHKQIS